MSRNGPISDRITIAGNTPEQNTMQTEIQLIEEFLNGIREYIQERYAVRGRMAVETKANASDLLTEVDVTVQHRAIDLLRERFPEDLFVGEEEGFARYPENTNARCWVMDPIDGTYNFVRGLMPSFGVSLAFVEHGLPQAGGVLFPISGDLFLATRGGGASRNGRALAVSRADRLDHACVSVDFSNAADRARLIERGHRLLREAGQVRCYGCAVLAICQIASGDAEAYLHMSLTPWDYAASQVIVEEAGGRASRLDGTPLRLFERKEGVLFTNGRLHSEVLSLI